MLASTEIAGLAVALGIGVSVGVERAHSVWQGVASARADIGMFVLIALGGVVAGWLGGLAVVAAGGLLVLAALLRHRLARAQDPGLTTGIAMFAVFLLSVLSMRNVALTLGLGAVVVTLLVAKAWLHGFARQGLSASELQGALLLTATMVIALPLLPDHAIDPWQVLNPRKLWLLAVLVMAINVAGHIALRSFGARLGLLLAGFAGGFVSSTATIASMGSRARDMPSLASTCAGAGVLSNVGTVVQLAVITGVLSPLLLQEIALPLLASGAVAVGFSLLAGWRTRRVPTPEAEFSGRAFKPGQVFGFVAIVAVVLLFSGMIRSWLGNGVLIWTLAASGLADVHAAAASAAQLVALDRLAVHAATLAILYAFTANSISKLVVAFSIGGRAYGLRLLPGIGLMLAAFAVVVLLH